MVFGALILFMTASLRVKTEQGFTVKTTAEVKGLAILLVVLSHIGYFLVSDHNFLTPVTNYAGVGVDLFLILSGYGLVAVTLKKPLQAVEFYKKRLSKVYVPVLITILGFLLVDAVLLNKYYPLLLTIKNLLGFFPQADLYQNINSPLWFITPLLVYYILFPLVFWRRAPVVTAIGLAAAGWLLVTSDFIWNLGVTGGVANLYKLHFLGFPLGILLGSLFYQLPDAILSRFKAFIAGFRPWPALLGRASLIALAALVWWYFSVHSGVGMGWKTEELISLVMALSVLLIFILKKTEFRLLSWFGAYSFEIYLLHWPLLYRYNFIYGRVPAGLATILYLALFLLLGYTANKALNCVRVKPAAK